MTDVESLYFQHEEQIEAVRHIFEKNRALVELIKKIEDENVEDEVDNESNDDYVEEETTDPVDIESFEKQCKAKAKKNITQYNAGIERMEPEKYLESVNSLTHQSESCPSSGVFSTCYDG